MCRQSRNYKKRKLVRTVAFLAAFFLSAAVMGKGFYLLASKCISVFAQEDGDRGAAEPVDDRTSGEKPVFTKVERNGWIVAIDPGHGGEDDGCYREGVSEAHVNLELARALSEKLQALGFETVMLREDNETLPSLEERVTEAAKAGAHIFVSIHQNAYDGTESGVSGIETWYCDTLADSGRLAQLIHEGAVQRTGAVDRGVQETDELYVVRNASMPACLIETAFLSDPAERNAITSKAYQDKLVEGMAEGIDAFFK
ncbi:MAG: N-acetylmuramoyl-L-alanine amidase [Lachnospiraceae bacterium]|nr:N-acetylmuramoyl-L-alanine amidase [Lachnospiraceae bacterium]